MNKIQKELVKTLLQAIIEDGKAGISNAVEDLNIDRLSDETTKIDYALGELINLQENEDGFNFHIFGKWLRNSNPVAKSIESCIREMLDYYKSVLNQDEITTTFVFRDSEIKELADSIDVRVAGKFKKTL